MGHKGFKTANIVKILSRDIIVQTKQQQNGEKKCIVVDKNKNLTRIQKRKKKKESHKDSNLFLYDKYANCG